jgi:hypothetical protein
MAEETNGHPVPRSVVQRVENKVDKLDDDLRSLSEALMGKPGLTDGVITELRYSNKVLRDHFALFEEHLPEAINAAIAQAQAEQVFGRVKAWNSWVGNVAAAFIAGFLVAITILIFHLGVTVAPK